MIDEKSFNTGYIISILFYGDHIRRNLCEKMDPPITKKPKRCPPPDLSWINKRDIRVRWYNSRYISVKIESTWLLLMSWHLFRTSASATEMLTWANTSTNEMIHYSDVIMGTMASQITSRMIVYSTVYSGADQRKHQNSASLAFVRVIHLPKGQWRGKCFHLMTSSCNFILYISGREPNDQYITNGISISSWTPFLVFQIKLSLSCSSERHWQ